MHWCLCLKRGGHTDKRRLIERFPIDTLDTDWILFKVLRRCFNRTDWRVWRPDRRAAGMPVQPPAALLPSAMPPVDTRPRSRRSRMIASVAAGRVLLTIRHERQPHLRGATQGVFRHHLHTRDGACTSLAWVVSCAREAMLEGNNLQQNCKLSVS